MFDTRNRKKLGKIQARYDTQYHRVINNQEQTILIIFCVKQRVCVKC